MGSEQQKSVIELAVFEEFISKANITLTQGSVSKPCTESDPDIFCTLISGEQVAYELVEICSPDIAQTLTRLSKNCGEEIFSTSNPTERTLRKKLHKTYRTNRPIELLCYTNGRTVSPDDLIIKEAQLWANTIKGPFRKVWLLGEKRVYEIWSAS